MISIVTPSYNAALFLAATVQSVQSQTVTAWELIIVDDGSKDETVAIAVEFAREDPRISVFQQANAGASAARNHGLSEADPNYPYALCLDSDDLLAPDALQRLLTLLESHPEAPAACGFLSDIDADGQPLEYQRFEPLNNRRGIDGFRLVRRKQDAPIVFSDLCFRNHIVTPGQVLVRKSALAIVGLFDTSLVYVEDYDMWWRLTMKVGPIPVTLVPVLLYRHHNTSISKNKTSVKRGATDWRWRVLTYPEMSPQQRRSGRIGYFYYCFVHWGLGFYYLRKGWFKLGVGLLLAGVREMIYYVRDLARSRRLPETQNPSLTR